MKRNLKALISVILLVCVLVPMLVSCTIERGYEDSPKGMRPITDGSEGAVAYVPIAWTVDISTGVPCAYFSSKDYTMVTLTTVKADEVGGKTPLQYYEERIPSLASELNEFEIIKKSDGTKNYESGMIGGRTCYTFEFTAKITGTTHKFSQVVVDSPKNGNVFILTYSAHTEVYDSHYSVFTQVKENFKFVDEPIKMVDKRPITLPSTEGIEVPSGFKLISNTESDYLMFVPESWTPRVSSGMTAATSSANSSVSVNAMSFNTTFTVIDDFWNGYKADLTATFSVFTPLTPEYSEIALDGYAARKYSYTIVNNGTQYRYEQCVLIRNGYVYLLTFCCKSADYNDTLAAEFNSIVSTFKFKG